MWNTSTADMQYLYGTGANRKQKCVRVQRPSAYGPMAIRVVYVCIYKYIYICRIHIEYIYIAVSKEPAENKGPHHRLHNPN